MTNKKRTIGFILLAAVFALALGMVAAGGAFSEGSADPAIVSAEYRSDTDNYLYVYTEGFAAGSVVSYDLNNGWKEGKLTVKAISGEDLGVVIKLTEADLIEFGPGSNPLKITQGGHNLNYSVKVYTLNLDSNGTAFSDESLDLSADAFEDFELPDPYVWNTESDKSGEWVSELYAGLFTSYEGTLYAFDATAVTVTADDASKDYGEDDPEFTATVSPEVAVVYTVDREEGEDPGTYDIIPTGEKRQGIYFVTYVPGTFTINKSEVEITVTGNNDTKTYDATELSVSGFEYDDKDGKVTVTLKDGEKAEAARTDAGTTYMGLEVGMFNCESDYFDVTLTIVDGFVTIERKAATVTADNIEKAFGEEDPELTATEDGIIDEFALIYELSRAEGEAVGTYAITVTGEEIQGNYTVSYFPGVFTITATSVVKPTGAVGLQYNGEEQVGVPSNDGYTLSGDFKAVDVGEYTATATLKDGYVWSDDTTAPVEVEWSIGLREITATADDKDKTVGSDDPALTVTVTGLLGEDTIDYTVSRAAGETVGEYTITVTGDAVQGYYYVTYVNGTFTINPVKIDKPIGLLGLIFNGEEQTGVNSGEGYTLSGDFKATNAGNYTAVATLDEGYAWSDDSTEPADVNWSIARKAATVTADNKSKAVGNEDPVLTATVTGVIDNYALVYTIEREAGEALGTYAIIPSGEAEQGNYSVEYVNGVFTIKDGEPAVWTKEPEAVEGLVYNKGWQAIVVNGTTDEGTPMYRVGEEGDYVAGSCPTVRDAGEYTVYYYIAGDADHLDSEVLWLIANIAPLEAYASVSPEGLSDLVYDGTTQELVSAGEADMGILMYSLDGEEYSADIPTGLGAGTYTVYYYIDATDPNYYDSAVKQISGISIALKAVTVTADDKEKVVGSEDPALTATVVGVVDEFEIVYEISRAAGETVGEYAITVTGEDVQGNYYVEFVDGVFTITPKFVEKPTAATGLVYNASEQVGVPSGEGYTLTGEKATNAGEYTAKATLEEGYVWKDGTSDVFEIAWSIGLKDVTVTADYKEKTFGTEDPVLTATVEGVIDDFAIVYALEREAGEDVGLYDITVTGEAVQGNYYVEFVDGLFVIIPAYVDKPSGAVGLEYNASEQVGVPSGEGYTLTGDFKAVNAGEYTATATLEDGYIWSDETTEPEVIVWYIGLKDATVYADCKGKIVGEEDPVLTATVEGVIDDFAIVYYLEREAGETAGDYTIYVTGEAVQGNYYVEFVDGWFTIANGYVEKPTAITGLVYNATEQTGVPSGEGYSLIGDKATNAGEYAALAALDEGYIWSDGSSEVLAIEWSIAKKDAKVTADNKEKVVGTEDPVLTATVEGVIDDFAIVYELSRAAGETVGTYAITATGEAEQGNYSVTYVNGVFTITPVSIDKPQALIGLIYNATELTGVPSGEGYTLTGEKAVNAGNYTATATLEEGYQWSDGSSDPASIAWSIAPKAATVTADPKEKAYGADDPELTATVEGVIDDFAIVYTLSRADGEAVGTYAITPSGEASQGNYAVTYVPGVFTIIGKKVDKPTAATGLVYNGTEQTGVPSGEGYTLANDKATNAGDYTATATLAEGYQWSDGSSDPASIAWSIAKKSVTVKADDKSKAVGAKDPELTATVDGVIGSDKLVYSISRAEGEAIGEYAITVTGDATQGNYTVSYVNGVFTITGNVIEKPKALLGLVYNGTEQTGVPSGTGYTLMGATAVNAGDYTAKAVLEEGYQWSDGSSAAADVSWSIAKKALDNSMVTVSGDFTYDGTEHTITYVVSDKSGDKEIITANDYAVTSGDKGTNAGQYALILDATENGNYYGQMSAAWSIAQKVATVTADDKEKEVGKEDPTLTATVTGVIDDFAIVYTVTRAAGEAVGEYAITPAGEVSQGNYTVEYVEGVFSIVYGERTITDASGKVSATGEIAEGAELVVVSKYDPADWENVDLSGKDIIKGLDISISSATEPAYTGTLDITIELGSKYNGTKVTVYHHHDDGSNESFTKTVHGGKVTITVSDLSPFLVAVERASPYIPSGDTTIVTGSDGNLIVLLAFATLTLSLIGLAVVIYKRK